MPGASSFVRLLVFLSIALAGPQAGKPLPAAKLEALEAAARGKAAAELLALAKFAESLKAVPEARAACSAAYVLTPRDDKARTEAEKLLKLKGERAKDAEKQFADHKAKAYAKCVELLTPVFAAYADADRSDELARLLSLLQDLGMPVEPLVKKHDFVFYAPYSDWRRKKDVERFTAGGEVLDGVWYDAKKVAELDAKHADWSGPWQFGEEIHEIKTTLPLTTARRILATVTSYRTFVLCYLGLDADLRQPAVKLPLIVTATRKEMEARAQSYPGGGGTLPPDGAAFYQGGSQPGGPCFVSFEMKFQGSEMRKVDFVGLRAGLLHEVAHQILYEYSRHGFDVQKAHADGGLNWVAEGAAEFLPCFEPDGGTWVLHRRDAVPQGPGGYIESGFGWCHDQADKLPPLPQFVTYGRTQMADARNYHVACVLAAFLLEAKERSYRTRFLKLLDLQHQYRAGQDAFAACFPGVDVAALDADFRAWCKEQPIEKVGGK
jgi:hypothetical protein